MSLAELTGDYIQHYLKDWEEDLKGATIPSIVRRYGDLHQILQHTFSEPKGDWNKTLRLSSTGFYDLSVTLLPSSTRVSMKPYTVKYYDPRPIPHPFHLITVRLFEIDIQSFHGAESIHFQGNATVQYRRMPLEDYLRWLVNRDHHVLSSFAGLPHAILHWLFNEMSEKKALKERCERISEEFLTDIKTFFFRHLDQGTFRTFYEKLSEEERHKLLEVLLVSLPEEQKEKFGLFLEEQGVTAKMVYAAARPLLAERCLKEGADS